MIRIDRKEYLDFLIKSKDKQIIKVVSGVRRCGKSTLFEIYKDYLLKNGVEKIQIISINFENMDYEELTDYKKLYKYIKSKMLTDKKNYIFLDEIQHVDKFEKVVDSLFIKENVDLYITGSNAYFMSSELATLLSGRYIELKMLPLSFKEYYKAKLEYENFEQEIDEESIYPYIFKINLFLDKEEKILKSKSPEIISEYNVPTIINYLIKGIHRNKIKIFFDEKLDEEEVSFEEIKFELKKELNISESEFFDFNFTIKGYYIYNVSTDTVEKIEVDKEIKFYNIKTLTKRILEIEGFKIEGKTYDEIKEEMYKYLNLMKNKEIIDKNN